MSEDGGYDEGHIRRSACGAGQSGGVWNTDFTSVDNSHGAHFQRYGLVAALALCVVTDFAAAFAMREINMKAGVETLIIALFVLLGVKSWIANFPFQFSAFIETLIVFIILPFLLATATRLVLRKIKSREWTNALFDTVFSPIQLFSLAIVIFAMFAGQTKIIIDNFNTLSLVPPRQGILH